MIIRRRIKDLGSVRIVPRSFLGVGEDLVGVDELLKGGGGVFGGDAGLNELVGVALEGEFLVGGADFVLCACLWEG